MEIVDVAIVGGGPSGAAAAISLRALVPHTRVLILESQNEFSWRFGETLSPSATVQLRALGCWEELEREMACGDGLPSFGTTAAWGRSRLEENDFLFSRGGIGWRLDRARFDRRLLGVAMQAGAELRWKTTLQESYQAGNIWVLRCQHGEVQARFVIDASGRRASFARQCGAKTVVTDQLLSTYALYDGVPESETMVEATEHGWWYSTSVPEGKTVVAWMTDADLLRARGPAMWHEELAATQHLKKRLQSGRLVMEFRACTAQSQYLDRIGGPRWVACGDAAMTFDPLSSHGITKALRSGRLASFVAADFLLREEETVKRYECILQQEFAQYQRTKRDVYRDEQRWPNAPFWSRRHG